MNAGKSTALLQSSYNYHERGMRTLLLTPAIDTRVDKCKIASRIGLEAQAVSFEVTTDLYLLIDQLIATDDKLKCVLIDEAQFLKKIQVEQLAKVTDQLNLPVLAYGLRTDFLGEPFEGSQYLLAWADQLIELKTICHCGRKATMNLRTDDQGRVIRLGEQIVIGGNERYISVCRKHFYSGEIEPIRNS